MVGNGLCNGSADENGLREWLRKGLAEFYQCIQLGEGCAAVEGVDRFGQGGFEVAGFSRKGGGGVQQDGIAASAGQFAAEHVAHDHDPKRIFTVLETVGQLATLVLVADMR